mmetsp:Transcript_44837/g.106403  ORF Transcript_44837/g.106403 Transcript_44837/m.106403 type:complete len:296 (-) Transcript_44837:36-923(-)
MTENQQQIPPEEEIPLDERRERIKGGQWWMLQDAPEELAADKELIILAVKANGRALESAADSLRADREVVMAAVTQDGIALKWVDETLRGDPEVAKKACSHSGMALWWASDAMRRNREVVAVAVRQDGRALEAACEELRSEPEIVASAIRTAPAMLQFATPELLGDGDFLLPCLETINDWSNIDNNYLQHCKLDMLQTIAPKVIPKFLLKISMISGKACVVVTQAGNTSKSVRWTCARFLGLTQAQNATSRLILTDGSLPDENVPIEKWPGVAKGHVNEIQLVVAYCGECRREDE